MGSDDVHDSFMPTQRAMLYASEHLSAFHGTHLHEIQRLLTFILYIPPDTPYSLDYLHIQVPAPYRSFLEVNAMHAPFLAPLFEAEWCAKEGVPREAPLQLAVEIGAGGALNRIAKVRAVMKQSGNEWSQADELPVSRSCRVCSIDHQWLISCPARWRSPSRRTSASTRRSPAPCPRSRAPRRTRRCSWRAATSWRKSRSRASPRAAAASSAPTVPPRAP